MSKAGSWLDKRLSKLIGVADAPDSQAEAARPPPGPQHRRAISQAPDAPKVGVLAGPSEPESIPHGLAVASRPHKSLTALAVPVF